LAAGRQAGRQGWKAGSSENSIAIQKWFGTTCYFKGLTANFASRPKKNVMPATPLRYKSDQTLGFLQISGIGDLQSFLSIRVAHRVIKASLLLKPFVFLL